LSGSEEPPTAGRPAAIVFGLLVVACFAAFAITQRLKHTPTVVQRFELTPFFSPTPSGRHKKERISFRIANTDEVTVTVLDSSGNEVATLTREKRVTRYKQFKLEWNGRRGENGSGTPAPAGEYRVRVRLRGQSRTVESPRGFKLVRR
jgi:hypothetical protein